MAPTKLFTLNIDVQLFFSLQFESNRWKDGDGFFKVMRIMKKRKGDVNRLKEDEEKS